MSNPLKAIGKVFKKVGKVVKKVALPALAIGAAVLTGGAALGVLPGIGSIGSSLGLSAGLTSVLSTAGQSALLGAGTSLITGGNPLKGATRGFVAGAALGGLDRFAGGSGQPLGNWGTGAKQTAADVAGQSGGLGSVLSEGPITSTPGTNAISSSVGATTAVPSTVAPIASSPVINAVTPASVAQTTQTAGGGLGGFLSRQPYLLPSLIQGVGGGLSAAAQAKEDRRTRQEGRDYIAGNYEGSGNFYPSGVDTYSTPSQGAFKRDWKWSIDPKTGQPFKEYVA